MAMLRVSSYHRLFEERWIRGSGIRLRCGDQYRPSLRVTDGQLVEPDFEVVRTLNEEGISRFVQERTLIAALNDRLALLIEAVRCLQEENKSLECEILELEEKQSQNGTLEPDALSDCSLEAVLIQLRRWKEEILDDVAKLKQELEHLQAQHAEVAGQRSLIDIAREDISMDVDAVTMECLALRDLVNIYSRELGTIQEVHEEMVNSLVKPAEDVAVVTLEFPSPNVAPAIQAIKEYYRKLAESLQYKPKEPATPVMIGRREVAAVSDRATDAVKVTDVSTTMDPGELRSQVADLQKELAHLEECGGKLAGEIEQRKEAHLEEINELECCVAELKGVQDDLETQMREQCGDYDELLSEKMALDIEISAYRGLVEQEENWLCYL